MPKSAPTGVVAREATPRDISSIAEILTAAPDDGLLYRYPDVPKYPDNMRRMYERTVRASLCKPTSLMRIAVVPDGSGTKVVGISSWVAQVPDPTSPGKTKDKEFRETTVMESMPPLSAPYTLF